MTNEQYSNMMIAFAKLEAKIEMLEELLKPYAVENKVEIQQPVLPEHLSNFWNEVDKLREDGLYGDATVPPKPFFKVGVSLDENN